MGFTGRARSAMHQTVSVSQRFLRGAGLFAVAVAGALASSCARAAPAAPSLLLDPQLVPGDQSSFAQNFQGGLTSIRLGPGWQEPEKGWPNTNRRGIGWAEKAARIYFGTPLAPAADLVAVCVPLVYPGAPPQVLTPVLNGRQLASQPMPRDWSELRIPLPAEALISPINTLDLLFAYQAVPAQVGMGADERSLAAAFDVLAVVPHGEPLTADVDATPALAGRQETWLSVRRRPTALPLPPARRIDVRLGMVHAAARGLRLGLDLETWDSSRQRLWHGAVEAASGRSFTLRVPGQRPARLLLEVEGGGGAAAAAEETVRMDPPALRFAPAAEPEPARPDVFVYLVDTLRADALGVYGARRPTSPRIDEFSRDAVVYEHAYSASSWTLPAIFSVLSGLYPSRHGVTVPGQRLASDRQPWLPELLSRRGYETLGISQWLLGGDLFGLDRGFESFYLDIRQSEKNPSANARWFLWHNLLRRRHPDRPLFTYLHVVDPHALYRPEGEDARFARERPGTLPPELYDPNLFLTGGHGRNRADVEHLRALYDGEVHAADRAFGTFVDLLKFFGLYDRSVIVLLGDHGEEFYEHGGFDHGRTLYDELLRVPLIVKLPSSEQAGTRIGAPVSLVDVAPTIAALAGAAGAGPAAQGFDGVPLPRAAAVAGERQRPIYAETRADAVNLRAVRQSGLKCIQNLGGVDRFSRPAPGIQLFDLAVDPGERAPLSPSDVRLERCRALLRQPPFGSRAETVVRRPLPPEEQARLRAMGYLR
jgi:arylsulfatase A-like enzyme